MDTTYLKSIVYLYGLLVDECCLCRWKTRIIPLGITSVRLQSVYKKKNKQTDDLHHLVLLAVLCVCRRQTFEIYDPPLLSLSYSPNLRTSKNWFLKHKKKIPQTNRLFLYCLSFRNYCILVLQNRQAEMKSGCIASH